MNKTPPKQFLVVLFYGLHELGNIETIAETINELDCTITQSRMIVLGQHASFNLQISGNWNALLKLESSLQTLAKTLKQTLFMNRIEPQALLATNQFLIYTIEVIASDRPGILFALSTFLTTQQINITEMYSNTYQNQLGTPLSNLVIRVQLPLTLQISEIREQLMLLCDAINVDAIFEPERI